MATPDPAAAPVRELPPSGVRVCFSSPRNAKPYYLQRVINDWDANRYWHAHALIGEEFATREEAEARAAELA